MSDVTQLANGDLQYKGFTARITVSLPDEDGPGLVWGRLLGIRDSISFATHGPDNTAKAFRESVDEYIADCLAVGNPVPVPVVEDKFQKAAALVREALEVAKNAHEEGTKDPEGELNLWERSSASQAVTNIEKALEALENEA